MYPNRSRKPITPAVIFGSLAAAFIVLVIIAAYVMAGRHKDQSTNYVTSPNTTTGSGTTELQRNAQNVSRKNDAANAASAVAEYMNNNSGTVPTAFQNGTLTGGAATYPAKVSFNFYKSVSVVQGAAPADTTDMFIIDTAAQCAPDGSTTAATSRRVAVQYSQATAAGGFEAGCIDM